MNLLRSLFTSPAARVFAQHHLRNTTFLSLRERKLFTEKSLGIDRFNSERKKMMQVVTNKSEFVNQMTEICSEGSDSLVFSTDLKTMLKIVESDDDLMLMEKMLKKFQEQSNSVRFQPYRYGPEVMRLLYLLNKPEVAFSLLTNEKMISMFDQLASYLILMDLLLKNEMYSEVLEVFETFKGRQFQGKMYPFSIVTCFFASCYKLNTPESFQKALEVAQEFESTAYAVPVRCRWYLSLLAVKQRKSYIVDHIIGNEQSSTGFSIWLMALAMEKHYTKVINVLKTLNQYQSERENKKFLLAEAMDFIEKEFKLSDQNLQEDLKKLKSEMSKSGIIISETFDSHLFQEIDITTSKKRPDIYNNFFRAAEEKSYSC